MLNNSTVRNKRVLLLYPEMPDTFWSMKHLVKLTGKKSAYPPLGLLTVASLLPAEWEIKLIDLNVTFLKEENLKEFDFVFISAMNVQSKSAEKIIEICKKNGKTVVAGGPLFTHQFNDYPDVDHFVLNEAEITLPEFLTDLEKGELKRIYQTDKFSDMNETQLPRWDLVDLKYYAYAIVQYSRGCPYLCDFCDVTTLFGRRPRVKTAEQIITELDKIIDNNIPEMILFADDNLIGNKNKLKSELLPALIEWRSKNKYAPGFATQVTINLADDLEMMRMMLEAGFRHIFIGIETPDEQLLKESRKNQNTKRNLLQNIQYLQENGFIVTGGFIVGFDSETETIFSTQKEFIKESGIVIATINVLKAPPGTELYDKIKLENRLLEPFDFDENKTNIILKMDEKTFHKGFKYLLENTYTPSNVYERAKYFIDNSGKANVKFPIKRKFYFNDLVTLFRSVWLVGILGNERKYYWKLLFYTLVNRPKRIVNSYLFIILMHQFQKLYERYLDSVIMRQKVLN